MQWFAHRTELVLDDGLVQQRHRRRSARSESRLGGRRRVVQIGRWRQELGAGELGYGAHDESVVRARRSARDHLPPELRRRRQSDRPDRERRRRVPHQQRARGHRDRPVRTVRRRWNRGHVELAQPRLWRDAVLSRHARFQTARSISPARRTTARCSVPMRQVRTGGGWYLAATAGSAPCIQRRPAPG